MEKRRKTYLDSMGVAPEIQAEMHSFINLAGGKSLAYSKEIVTNPHMFQASIVFFVVPIIGSIAHNLGYISDQQATALTVLIGLPLFYLITLMSTAMIILILFVRFLKTIDEDARRDRQ